MVDTRKRKSDFTPEAWARKLARGKRSRDRNRDGINSRRRATYSPTPRATLPPVPSAPTGHPLYEQARAALHGFERAELGSDMDTTARDLVQEFALAALEGRDCLEAMRRFRSAANKRRKTFVYGLDMTTDLAR